MTTLTRIGNSQGIRIPKAIIELAQLENKDLSFKVTDEGLLILNPDKTGKSSLIMLFNLKKKL